MKGFLLLFLRAGLLFSTVVQFACATPAEIKREASSPVKPDWIQKLPRSEDTLYFVGISTSAETFEISRNEALRDGMAQISNYMGTKIESTLKSYITEIERDLSFQIKSESVALVKGAKISDSYSEKIIRIDKNFRMARYDVYLLISFSIKEVEEEQIRQRKEKFEKLNTAFKFYLIGLSAEKRKQFYPARRAFKQAMDLISKISDVVEMEGKEIKNSAELKLTLETHLKYATSQLLKISFSINVEGLEESKRTFISNFSRPFVEHDFTVTNEAAAFKIMGNISVSGNGYLMNNYVYYAKGNVQAERTSDHQVVATYSFTAKGFHRQKKQAALNALAEAGIEAGNALSGMVMKKVRELDVSDEGR